MNIKELRTWFIVGNFVLMLIAAAPTLTLLVRFPSGSDRFSELWLLGSTHKAEDYPFNVTIGQNYRMYVGVGNHLGYCAYYRVYVKLRNQTQPLPVASDATPSPLAAHYESDFFVRDSEAWELQMTFAISSAEFLDGLARLSGFSVNGVTFDVDIASTWSEQRSGFYYQLFFELWLYDNTMEEFRYHNRFVGIWLNVTSRQADL